MKLMDIDQEHLGIPDTVYDAEITLPASEFARIIRDLKEMGESVKIEVSKDGVRFSAEGDIGNASVTLKQTNSVAEIEEDDEEEEEDEEEDEEEEEEDVKPDDDDVCTLSYDYASAEGSMAFNLGMHSLIYIRSFHRLSSTKNRPPLPKELLPSSSRTIRT